MVDTRYSLIMAVPIAILLVFLAVKLSSYVTNVNKYEDAYNENKWVMLDSNGKIQETITEQEKMIQKENLKKARTTQFIILIIIGVIATLSGMYLNLPAPSYGLIAGGVLTLIYSTYNNWKEIKEHSQLAILTAAFVSVFGLTIKYTTGTK